MNARPLVALYSGLIVEGDAVSGSLRAKLGALRKAKHKGLDVEVVAFCQHSNVEDPAIEVVPRGVAELVGRRSFRRASVHIFEFGIYYQLFNAAHILAPGQMAAVYHNITPRELVVDPVVQVAIERSLLQKHLLAQMSRVVCDSEFSRLDLVDFGIPANRLKVLPLPGSFSGPPPSPRAGRSSAEPVRFLFVGRLVRAKGVLDLLTAAQRLVEGDNLDFELVLAGRVDGSDLVTTQGIAAALESPAMGAVVRFLPDASVQDLAAAYSEADVFIMPSYHEGYCVPIVEAFRAACPVIGYDNTNIPLVTAGLADLVPTGDVEALAAAMARAINGLHTARSQGSPYLVMTASGGVPEPEWRKSVLTRVGGLQAAHDDGFVALVRELLSPGGGASQGREATHDLRQTASAMPI